MPNNTPNTAPQHTCMDNTESIEHLYAALQSPGVNIQQSLTVWIYTSYSFCRQEHVLMWPDIPMNISWLPSTPIIAAWCLTSYLQWCVPQYFLELCLTHRVTIKQLTNHLVQHLSLLAWHTATASIKDTGSRSSYGAGLPPPCIGGWTC